MLVVTRRDGETIVIETDKERIVIKLFEIKRGRARVGIEAPENVDIIRGELLE